MYLYTSFCSRFKIRLNVKNLHKHSSIRWPPDRRAIHRRRKVRSPEGVVWEHVGGEHGIFHQHNRCYIYIHILYIIYIIYYIYIILYYIYIYYIYIYIYIYEKKQQQYEQLF